MSRTRNLASRGQRLPAWGVVAGRRSHRPRVLSRRTRGPDAPWKAVTQIERDFALRWASLTAAERIEVHAALGRAIATRGDEPFDPADQALLRRLVE